MALAESWRRWALPATRVDVFLSVPGSARLPLDGDARLFDRVAAPVATTLRARHGCAVRIDDDDALHPPLWRTEAAEYADDDGLAAVLALEGVNSPYAEADQRAVAPPIRVCTPLVQLLLAVRGGGLAAVLVNAASLRRRRAMLKLAALHALHKRGDCRLLVLCLPDAGGTMAVTHHPLLSADWVDGTVVSVPPAAASASATLVPYVLEQVVARLGADAVLGRTRADAFDGLVDRLAAHVPDGSAVLDRLAEALLGPPPGKAALWAPLAAGTDRVLDASAEPPKSDPAIAAAQPALADAAEAPPPATAAPLAEPTTGAPEVPEPIAAAATDATPEASSTGAEAAGEAASVAASVVDSVLAFSIAAALAACTARDAARVALAALDAVTGSEPRAASTNEQDDGGAATVELSSPGNGPADIDVQGTLNMARTEATDTELESVHPMLRTTDIALIEPIVETSDAVSDHLVVPATPEGARNVVPELVTQLMAVDGPTEVATATVDVASEPSLAAAAQSAVLRVTEAPNAGVGNAAGVGAADGAAEGDPNDREGEPNDDVDAPPPATVPTGAKIHPEHYDTDAESSCACSEVASVADRMEDGENAADCYESDDSFGQATKSIALERSDSDDSFGQPVSHGLGTAAKAAGDDDADLVASGSDDSFGRPATTAAPPSTTAVSALAPSKSAPTAAAPKRSVPSPSDDPAPVPAGHAPGAAIETARPPRARPSSQKGSQSVPAQLACTDVNGSAPPPPPVTDAPPTPIEKPSTVDRPKLRIGNAAWMAAKPGMTSMAPSQAPGRTTHVSNSNTSASSVIASTSTAPGPMPASNSKASVAAVSLPNSTSLAAAAPLSSLTTPVLTSGSKAPTTEPGAIDARKEDAATEPAAKSTKGLGNSLSTSADRSGDQVQESMPALRQRVARPPTAAAEASQPSPVAQTTAQTAPAAPRQGPPIRPGETSTALVASNLPQLPPAQQPQPAQLAAHKPGLPPHAPKPAPSPPPPRWPVASIVDLLRLANERGLLDECHVECLERALAAARLDAAVALVARYRQRWDSAAAQELAAALAMVQATAEAVAEALTVQSLPAAQMDADALEALDTDQVHGGGPALSDAALAVWELLAQSPRFPTAALPAEVPVPLVRPARPAWAVPPPPLAAGGAWAERADVMEQLAALLARG